MGNFNLFIKKQQYADKTVLREIDQQYEVKKIHGILGENGSGKTTLFHCMTNLIPYTGKPMISQNVVFGYLPAELYMYSMITGEEFLRFYVKAKGRYYNEVEKNRLNEFLELPLNEYAETYSTGMLKKLYLLGLLLQNNELLLLDEPFNGLDFKSSAFITALLQRKKEEGITIFVASHELDHLFSFTDTISLIQDQQLTFFDSRETFEFMRKSITNEANLKVESAMGKICSSD